MTGAPEERHSSPLTPHPSRLSLIVAMAKNRVIGLDNKIPWHLPAELKLFKDVTMGHHIVMGRRTWESINRLLPGRTSVIVTRQADYRVPGALVVHSLEEALAVSGADEEVFVIGGAQLFRESLARADRLHLTVVDAEPEGDTYMPPIDFSTWRAVKSEHHAADERNPLAYDYTMYERIR
ncbi:MAG: dihydrofolate reductase [Rhodospirillaceae bacterium]